MRTIAFSPEAFKEYNEWFEKDLQIIDRIKILIRDIDRDPFKGLGKPEPLKGNYSGYWSRRIDYEHRLSLLIYVLAVTCSYYFNYFNYIGYRIDNSIVGYPDPISVFTFKFFYSLGSWVFFQRVNSINYFPVISRSNLRYFFLRRFCKFYCIHTYSFPSFLNCCFTSSHETVSSSFLNSTAIRS